jgi:hypothetical protein
VWLGPGIGTSYACVTPFSLKFFEGGAHAPRAV